MSVEIERVGVVGAGLMGSQIAQVLAVGGCTVQMFDIDAEQLRRALENAEHGQFGMRRGVARGKLTNADADAAMTRLSTTTSLGEVCSGADMVIEVVPEDLGLKIEVFGEIDKLADEDTILTSNTSGFSITALAHATTRPERVMGWHWFRPCAVMPLVELIVHERTSPEVVDAVTRAAVRAGKRPQVVKDQPMEWGFVGSRIIMTVHKEACRIVEEGVATKEQVNAIMRDGFRWPWGPFEFLEP
jgi:3-hydroxybutyryl-CoA dehydrogenase